MLGESTWNRPSDDLVTIMRLHGVVVTVARTVTTSQQLDAFAEPSSPYTPATFQTSILVQSADLDVQMTAGGGKNVELLTFLADHAVIEENDEVTYSGSVYKVLTVRTSTIGQQDIADVCVGHREVA